MKLLILLAVMSALSISCGKEARKKCWEEYRYEYNGYTYVEKKVFRCEPVED